MFRIPPESCRSEFTYVFTNGVIFPDHIQFGDPLMSPLPGQPSFSFVISNSMDAVSINGTVIAPCPGSADLPEEFQHTNVVAVLMPTATMMGRETQFTGISLEGDPRDLAKGPVKIKRFFESDNQDDYAELFTNIELAAHRLEVHEKDEEYRSPVIRA